MISIGNAFRQIKHGYIDAVLAGAVEIMRENHVHITMDALGAFSHDPVDKAVKPFDVNRKGTVLGDGGGIVVVESLESALKRKAKIYYEIVGFHQNTEAFHLTASNGTGILKCMIQALLEAKLTNQDISVISAHGTATPIGDEVEAKSIKVLLGTVWNELATLAEQGELTTYKIEELVKIVTDNPSTLYANNVPITASKGNLGHTGAASGAIECVIAALIMKENLIPQIYGLNEPCDP